jgi:hypothetical protein
VCERERERERERDREIQTYLHEIAEGHVSDLVAPGRVDFAEAAGALESDQSIVVHAIAAIDTEITQLGQQLSDAAERLISQL